MKCLSLLQPWASLLAMGVKKIETRSWQTPYRGMIYIHASQGKRGSETARSPIILQHIPDFKALSFGAIIGEGVLVDILRVEDLQEKLLENMQVLTLEERAFGNYAAGRYCWIFQDCSLYEEPISATGRLGLFEF